jgi:hypothetical protein
MIQGFVTGVALLTTTLTVTAADAIALKPPQISNATVDWSAARRDLAGEAAVRSVEATESQEAKFARLNAAAERFLPGIAKSNTPVLLPLDLDRLLNPAEGAAQSAPTAGFRLQFFRAGPTGYDAVFAVSPDFADDITGHRPREDVSVLVSGFALLYQLDAPHGVSMTPVKSLEPGFPGIRRIWLESHVRYVFERYGVTYMASMLCAEGPRKRWIACRDADRIITRLLVRLRLAGGAEQAAVPLQVDTIERPSAQSPNFSFGAPGQLIHNTGSGGGGGHRDWTVYAKMTFPLAQAPAFANSQSFMHWGNCNLTGRTSRSSKKGARYRCKVNDKPLIFDESAIENRSYPWRDNFCERRGFFVGQCPNGRGHQGQDIRPATCRLRNKEADRCLPDQDDVVAVRDGMILRVGRRESLYLLVNAPGERIRFRYLHMNPRRLDAGGMTSGRVVREGEVLGKASNYDRRENGTTYHLHFDMQVPTQYGWTYVNPYMTLVTAYERLIGARGQLEVDERIASTTSLPQVNAPMVDTTGSIEVAQSAASAAAPRDIVAARELPIPAPREVRPERKSEKRIERASIRCKARVSSRRGSHGCKHYAYRYRVGAKHGVRKLGHSLSSARHRARHFRGYLQPRHGRVKARYVGI